MSGLRASLRPLRFELVAIAMLALLAFAVAGSTAGRLLLFGIPRACLDGSTNGTSSCAQYAGAIDQYRQFAGSWLTPTFLALASLPVVAALLAGVGLVGKEIDQRTTVFAWSLAPSRGRWLLLRLAPIWVALGIIALVAGGLGDMVESLGSPTIDQARNFEGLGVRGIANAGAVTLVLGTALFAGAAIGRVLPALLVAGALAGGALVATSSASDAMLVGDSVVVDASTVPAGSHMFETLVRTPEGRVISWNDAYAQYGPDFGAELGQPGSGFVEMARIVPGSGYAWAAMRLMLLEAIVGLVLFGLAIAVVQRRRP